MRYTSPLFILFISLVFVAQVLSVVVPRASRAETREYFMINDQMDGLAHIDFDQRVHYQEQIERFYYEKREWPEVNPGEKPSFNTAISSETISEKVADYCRKTNALHYFWDITIRSEELQAEIDRMLQNSKKPDQLKKLIRQLDDDPFLVAECFARPLLVDRIIREKYSQDERFQGEQMNRARVDSSVPRSNCPFDQWWPEVRALFGVDVIVTKGDYTIDWSKSPTKDTEEWEATGIDTNTPSGRSFHSGIYTGAEVIIWGGYEGSSYLNSGGRYYPETDTWLTTSEGTNVPTARYSHTAVWTGSEMIVWGGNSFLNTGGCYDPASDTWTATNTTHMYCPTARDGHTAVWSGEEMVVWGGYVDGTGDPVNTGGKYYPDTDSWDQMGTAGSCPEPRRWHSAVYTNLLGMVVWGGNDWLYPINTGAHYMPGSDNWVSIGTTNLPTESYSHSAIINASGKMVIWGGRTSSGCTSRGSTLDDWTGWSDLESAGAPSARFQHGAILASEDMIVWGGQLSSGAMTNTGGIYNFYDDTWTSISTTDAQTPAVRDGHTLLWMDGVMLVWGGRDNSYNANYHQTGGIYYICWASPSTILNNTADDLELCSDSGVEITWPRDPTTWGCEEGYKCHYDVLRDGLELVTDLDYGTTSYTDTTGTDDISYTYSVRYRNACDQSVTTTGVIAGDYIASAPIVTVDHTNTDVDGCTVNSGIEITWPQDPGGDWGDNGSGDRKYRVWRLDNVSGTWQALGSQIDYGTTSYTDSTTITGYQYLYYVRYINGCGENDTTAAQDWIMDSSGSNPTVSQSVTAIDANECAYTGIQVTWPQDADDWGDSGTGTRYYHVYRSMDGLSYSEIGDDLIYGTVSYIDSTAAADVQYYYQVRYINGCALDCDSGADTTLDQSSVTPSDIPAFTAFDLDICADTGVEITWPQNPGDWGDRDIDPDARYYRVWRGPNCTISNMSGIGDTIPYGTTTYIDNEGTDNTDYCYRVRYINACDKKTYSAGQTDISDDYDQTPCAAVDDSLTLTKDSSDVTLTWTEVDCGDLDIYWVYASTSLDSTTLDSFPTGWDIIATPASATQLDSLTSDYQAYKIVSVDLCGLSSE
ncbi:hypothetical protein JXQ70_06970 [bacterium]|nr:hypothetical protein [bacterium]